VPGDRISIIADNRNLKNGTQFKGDHTLENNYLVAYENLKTKSQPQDIQSFYSQNETEFIKAVENLTSIYLTDQQEYQKKNGPFDEIFAELISDETSYDAAIMKINYPTYYEYLNPDKKLKLSDTFDSFLQNIEIDADENLLVPAYKQFLPLYLDFKANLENTNSVESKAILKFKLIGSLFQSVKVKELLYYTIMKETMDNSVNDAALLIEDYSKLQTNTLYNEEVNTVFNTWRHLLKGKKAPSWQYLNHANKPVSLESFIGKVVYIDVWATWCGPCLRELPYLEKLQEEFKGNNNIAFISISIDQEKLGWDAMVKSKNMKGIQCIADNAWNSSIVTEYRITGIPRFIIIDKQGNIADVNAPRPSSKTLKPALEELIKI
jgi:thiol-disulfide isomerase/thioredoxin